MAKRQKKVSVLWRCGKCKSDGRMTVYAYPGETPAETAARQQRQTRGTCKDGCGFSATAEATR